MATTKKIYSIIIPVYLPDEHMRDLAMKCLQTLSTTLPLELSEIIIIDNGSINSEVELYCDIYKKHKEPIGYAKAVNEGLRLASGEILIIANQDLEFEHGWLYELTEPLKEYGICSLRESDYYGETTSNRLEENGKFGCLWAMTRGLYNTLGGLSEDFGRGFFEDTEYHLRAKKRGIRIVKNHRAYIIHREPSSSFIAGGIREDSFNISKKIYEDKIIGQRN